MNAVKISKPKRNVFDLTHDVKTSFNMGELVPIMVEECVPGDKFKIGCDSLIKFAPMVAPVMHRMDVTIHYFFVPYRILWQNDGFQHFIMDMPREGEPAVPAFPWRRVEAVSRLDNYLGIPFKPTGADGDHENINAMAHAAYQCIYNEYYRDQNLIAPINYKLVDGDNSGNAELDQLRRRAWGRDYFTSALPYPQAGAAVEVPLGDVVAKPYSEHTINPTWKTEAGGVLTAGNVTGSAGPAVGINQTGGNNTYYDPGDTLEVEATLINNLRKAFKLQEWQEKALRGGRRFKEFIRAMFGVETSDARLQRPEYITGIKAPVIVNEVLNTTGDAGTGLPQGNMSGHGQAALSKEYSGDYYCEEHGLIIGIMSVMPITAYIDGLPRFFTKTKDFTQYYFEQFAHLGEQPILAKEIYAFNSGGEDTFAYTPMYSEYRVKAPRVSGDFAKDNSLLQWHLARKFEAMPSFSQDFIECNPSSRIFAVEDPDVQKMYVYHLNRVKAIRPIPVFGTPTF